MDKQELQRQAWNNVIVNVTGESKSGKTHLALRSSNPRYVAYFDRNSALPAALLGAEQAGFPVDAVRVEIFKAMPYAKLTQEIAGEYYRRVQALAEEAIAAGSGTFIVDGALMMKGYIEKWKLGESATLGYRAKSGERGVSQIQYAETNAIFNDFVAQFAHTSLDLILTWEGRRVWEEVWEDGRKNRRPTNKFRSSSPENMSFAINAEVQTMVEDEVVVIDNRPTDQTRAKHRVRIGYNAFNSALRGRIVKVDSFEELKELFLAGIAEGPKFEAPKDDVVEVAE